MVALWLALGLVAGMTASASPPPPTSPAAGLKPAAGVRASETYGRLPLSFEANQGQTDAQVRFLSRGRGYTLFLTSDEVVLALRTRKPKVKGQKSKAKDEENPSPFRTPNPESRAPVVLRLKLLGANPAPQITGLEELPGKSSYFIGSDPQKWRTNLPRYARVRYENTYPGIDLIYYGNPAEAGQLEYDFTVAPGAEPSAITLSIEARNAEVETRPSKAATAASSPPTSAKTAPLQTPSIAIDANGDLVIATDAGEIRLHKPVIYQRTANPESRAPNPGKQFLDGRYVLFADNRVGFEVSDYDRSRALIIDPVLSYSTYLGGSDPDIGYGIAVDASGSAYVTGSAGSTDFPTASPFQTANGGDADAFVAKLNPEGTALVYSTYLGGNGFDRALGIAVDSSGNAYVTGSTASANFPTTSGVIQTTFGDGTCGTAACADAFVTKLDAAGSALVYSTYLGGSDADSGQGIAVDSSGNAYVIGSTQSADFPTAAAFQSASAGGIDAFVAKLNAGGTALAYATYLGGGGADFGHGIALDSSGNASLTGFTFSTNFPTTANPLQATNAGSTDAFVAKLEAAGAALAYSTYLGGSGFDRGFAIALDAAGNAYVTGDTASPDFPTSAGSYQTAYHENGDAFVAKLEAGGSALAYATYLGGTDTEQGLGIAVDAGGNAYLTGFTQSSDFPTLSPLQEVFGAGLCGSSPCSDAFATKLNETGSALAYSTYLGGSNADLGQGIVVDSSGNAYVTGSTASPNFPATAGTLQAMRGGTGPAEDAFLAKISPIDAPAVALSPQKLTFADQATGFTSPAQTVTLTNSGSAPLTIYSIEPSGDFARTTTCGPVLAAGGASCTISVTFTPTETGDRAGTVSIADDAAGTPHLISLAGKGVTPTPAVTLSPSELTFPDQTVGSTSDPQTITLTNSGTAELTISSIAVGSEFAETHEGCGASLSVAASCLINVTFKPTKTGTLTAAVSVEDNAEGSPHRANVSGVGIAVFSLSATNSSVTLNRGTDSTTFAIAATAPPEFTSSINLSCTGASSATCTFSPASIKGGESSTLTVSNLKALSEVSLEFDVSGTSGTQTATLALTILFADFSVSAAPTFASIASGQAATFTLTITPVNGFTGTVSFSCGALPRETTCAFSPASVTLDGTNPATAEVTVQTTLRSGVAPPPKPQSPLPLLLILMVGTSLATVAYAARRRVAGFVVPAAAILLFALLLSACGGTEFFAIRGTPSGTFGITFIGTSGDASHSATVALTIS